MILTDFKDYKKNVNAEALMKMYCFEIMDDCCSFNKSSKEKTKIIFIENIFNFHVINIYIQSIQKMLIFR